MDIKFGILILLKMALPQKLFLVPSITFRGNMVHNLMTQTLKNY